MYCPRCSQQQASDEMRFCSRCGFPLQVVSELLAGDGVLAMRQAEAETDQLSPRQKGIRQGAKLMLVGLVLGTVMALLSVFVLGRPEVFVSISTAIFFMSGLARILYAYIFEQGVVTKKQDSQPARLGATACASTLPPPQTVPVTTFGTQRIKTAEIVQPPSVTEHPTKLFENK